ncbi:MAG: hypothetical protein HY651_00925 [Acidobacteria bacterium]|nr:hypothetical protein [Acidobacteriota bacterium]
MLRRLATFALLVPLFLNGLWMVCADGQSPSETAATPAKAAEAAPHCTKAICPLEKPATGAICLISSNGDGSSIAAFMFAVAQPPAAESPLADAVVVAAIAEQPAIYENPTLSGSTPPPKA